MSSTKNITIIFLEYFPIIFSRFFGTAAQFLVTWYLSYSYGAHAVGEYNIAFSLCSTLGIFLTFGLSTQLLLETAKLKKNSSSTHNSLLSVYLGKQIFLALSILAIAYLFILITDVNTKEPLPWSQLAIMSVFWAINKINCDYLKGKEFIKTGLLLEFGALPIFFIIPFITSETLTFTSPIVVEYLLVNIIITAALSFLVALRLAPFTHKSFKAEPMPKLTKETIGIWLSNLAGVTLSALPYLLMPIAFSTNEIGMFAIAHRLIGVISTANIALCSKFMPKLAVYWHTKATKDFTNTYKQSRMLSMGIIITLCVFYLFFSHEIISIFGSRLDIQKTSNLLFLFVVLKLLGAIGGLTENLVASINNAKDEAIFTWTTIVLFTTIFFIYKEHISLESFTCGFAGCLTLRTLFAFCIFQSRRNSNESH